MPDSQHTRFEEDQLFVALGSDEFDQKLRGLMDDEDYREIQGTCEAIVYCRGDLPPASSLWHERLFWLLSFLVILCSIYGAACLIGNLLGMGSG